MGQEKAVFCCNSGKRPQIALEEVKDPGYRQVCNPGSIIDWLMVPDNMPENDKENDMNE